MGAPDADAGTELFSDTVISFLVKGTILRRMYLSTLQEADGPETSAEEWRTDVGAQGSSRSFPRRRTDGSSTILFPCPSAL